MLSINDKKVGGLKKQIADRLKCIQRCVELQSI